MRTCYLITHNSLFRVLALSLQVYSQVVVRRLSKYYSKDTVLSWVAVLDA